MTTNPPTKPTGEKKEYNHWWLKSKKFKRVRLSTIERLALLYSAECFGKKPPYSHDFVIWLENYMEEI